MPPNNRQPRRIDQITPGFYKVRRVAKGPWVAAQIIVQDGMIYVTEDDFPVMHGMPTDAFADALADAVMAGEAFRHPLLRVAWFGEPVTEAEYRYLIAQAMWAREHAPGHPVANPDKPIDANAIPIDMIF